MKTEYETDRIRKGENLLKQGYALRREIEKQNDALLKVSPENFAAMR